VRKELLITFVITALILSLTITSLSITSPTGLPYVSVDPSTTTVEAGLNFDIDITVTDVPADPELYSWSVNLTFDKDVLECTGAEEGPFLDDVWPYWTITEWVDPTIKNEFGWVELSCAIVGTTYGGATGSGLLATIHFQAQAVGSTPLNFSAAELSTVNPQGVSVPMDQDPSHNGTVTVMAGHDVAVGSITAPAEAASNSSVSINVTVKNEGSELEEANVTIRYDTTYIASQNVTLAGGSSTTVPFTWDTTEVAAETYTLNATATIPEDNDLTDNSNTAEIRIVEYDVAVTDVDAPSAAKAGATVPINVAVENQGCSTQTLNVTVSYDSTLIGFNNTVELPAQNSTIVPFSWNTEGVGEGTYTINATATIPAIPVDDDLTDNFKITTIYLYLLHDVNVTSVKAPTWARYDSDGYPLGDTVYINVTVKNDGDYPEEANVTLRYKDPTGSPFYIDSQNLTLTKGENDTAFFTWDTSGLTPGDYYVEANATIPWDDDIIDNTDIRFIKLTAHDVNVTSITAPPYGYPNNVLINVTVENEGDFAEKVNVTIRYGTTFMDSQNLAALGKGTNRTLSLSCDTGLTPGNNYILTINATATVLESVPPEGLNPNGIDDDLADNTLVDDVTVFITLAGDVNGDRTVDYSDLSDLNEAYGSESGDSNWDQYCDFNGDGKVDAVDLFDLSKNYGKTV